MIKTLLFFIAIFGNFSAIVQPILLVFYYNIHAKQRYPSRIKTRTTKLVYKIIT